MSVNVAGLWLTLSSFLHGTNHILTEHLCSEEKLVRNRKAHMKSLTELDVSFLKISTAYADFDSLVPKLWRPYLWGALYPLTNSGIVSDLVWFRWSFFNHNTWYECFYWRPILRRDGWILITVKPWNILNIISIRRLSHALSRREFVKPHFWYYSSIDFRGWKLQLAQNMDFMIMHQISYQCPAVADLQLTDHLHRAFESTIPVMFASGGMTLSIRPLNICPASRSNDIENQISGYFQYDRWQVHDHGYMISNEEDC